MDKEQMYELIENFVYEVHPDLKTLYSKYRELKSINENLKTKLQTKEKELKQIYERYQKNQMLEKIYKQVYTLYENRQLSKEEMKIVLKKYKDMSHLPYRKLQEILNIFSDRMKDYET